MASRPVSKDENSAMRQTVESNESPPGFVETALAEYEKPLLGYARGLLKDHERARDVVQDTFLRLHRQAPDKIAPENLKAWLYTVCRNRSLDILRKESAMKTTSVDALQGLNDSRPDPAHAALRRERCDEVMKLLERLPHNQQEVIRLKFQADLSYREISEITDLSVSNVGFLLHTGLKRLRQLMSHDLETEGNAG